LGQVAIAHVHLSDWLVKKCSSYYFLTLPFIDLCTLYLNPPLFAPLVGVFIA
jgi:hypothetical protein